MSKQFLIDEELANKLLAYLSEEKYKDVYEICEGLLHLKEVAEQPKV